MSDPIMALEELENIVKSKEAPFQIFVKTLNGKTISIDDVTPQTTIFSMMKTIEAKEGLATKIQRLDYAGKDLHRDLTAADYNITKEATLHSKLRLRGGDGERVAMEYLIEKDIDRGNVWDDIKRTKGESTALTAWGRELGKDESFLDEVADIVPLNDDNYVHVTALIQEVAHSGNCGDFAQIVQSKLLRSTKDQYVYTLVMYNLLPLPLQSKVWNKASEEDQKLWVLDKGEFEFTKAQTNAQWKRNWQRWLTGKGNLRPKMFDHEVCITYPEKVDKISDMDDRAMMMDGWYGNVICPLSKFLRGINPYSTKIPETTHWGTDYPNLILYNGQKATGTGFTDGQVAGIKALIEEKLKAYKESADFEADKQQANKVSMHNPYIFHVAGKHDKLDIRITETEIADKLNAIDVATDMDTFYTNCLDLTSLEVAHYFFGTQIQLTHRTAIWADDGLKGHLFSAIMDKLLDIIPLEIARRILYYSTTDIAYSHPVNPDLIGQLDMTKAIE